MLLDRLAAFAAPLLAPYADLLDQRHPLTYAGSALFVLLIAMLVPHRRAFSSRRLRALSRLIFRRQVWLHRSSVLDYKLYGVSMLFLAFGSGLFVVGSSFWAENASQLLTWLFGKPEAAATTVSGGVVAIITLTQLFALDFGYWLGHFAMHKSELLWEFHKVHHSAEVMTPATEFRQHPVEYVLIPTVIGLTSGLAFAGVTHAIGTGAPRLGQSSFNIIMLLHLFTFQHLRHSHIAMAFTGRLGILFHSPAHHHIHHSADPAHHDRNMGYFLSIWDWMAGTLLVPTGRDRLTLGIGPEGRDHDSVRSAWLLPVQRVMARFRSGPAEIAQGDRSHSDRPTAH